MRDDPVQIAERLVEQHGIEGALEAAWAGITAAQTNGDYYSLSVWREVRRELRDKQDAPQETPEV